MDHRAYYAEPDPLKRLELLEAGLASGEEPELWAIRKAVFERRYFFNQRENHYADRFMGAFMELLAENRRNPKRFGRSARKRVLRELGTLGLDRETGEPEETCLFEEFCHLARVYEDLCRHSRNYGSLLMGIGSLSPEQLAGKIRSDLMEVGRELPDRAELQEEFALLSEALLQAAARVEN